MALGHKKMATVASLASWFFALGLLQASRKMPKACAAQYTKHLGVMVRHPICKAIPKKKPQLGIAYEVHFPGPPINPNVQGPHQVQETLHKGFSIAPKTSAMSLADFFWGKSKKLRQFIVILTYFILQLTLPICGCTPFRHTLMDLDGFG